MQTNIIKFSFIFLCFFYSGINIIAQEKSPYENAEAMIEKFKKSKLKPGIEYNDDEGNTYRIISSDYSMGAEIKLEKKWHKHDKWLGLSNGKISWVITYEYGSKYGESITFHDNGKIKRQTNYKHNLEDGTQFNYREDGTLDNTEEYIGGYRNGAYISYYSDGKTKKEEYQYKDDKPVSRMKFNKKGELNEKCAYDKKGNIIHRQKFK